MSVEVLVPKPLPTVTVNPSTPGRGGGMKELRGRQRPEGSARAQGGDPRQVVGSSSSYQNHRPHPHQQLQQQPLSIPQSPHDISQNFDPTHIIYDSTTDTTYLRGRLLGKGGFARCYELLSLSNNKIYAGKIISKTRISKPHQKQKILREVELQQDLKHRNVVEFHSYFEDDSNVYIILENCSRKSLVHVLKHRKYLTEPEVRFYMQQLVEGVQYVHLKSIIHRDLKLGNMLLNEDMELKLADFGLATKVDFEGEMKMTVCGTPNYIAPEVLQKKGHSFEADIWAVGCIMYALLVGRPPFETTTLKETYLRITENSFKVPSHISGPAANLIRKCLNSTPSQRPTLRELNADEFFTTGYMPRTLPPSCCTSMPKFPAHYKSSSNRPMSYAFPNESRSDPMGQLGNALSRMQLNSRSENLLEEKELEAIEKRSPRHSPVTESQGHGPSIKAVAKEVAADRAGDRSHSPPQREPSPKQRSAANLLEVLSTCLEHMPNGSQNPPAMPDSNIVWVTKWVDYSNKYGFGFMLSSDALGVLFNDTSRILMSPDGRAIQYYDLTGKLSAYTLDCVPEELDRKTTLLQYFARYMDEHLIQGGDLECSQYMEISWSSILYLKKWFRTTKAIVLYLSDGTLQVNFFEDHTKLILSNVKNEYLVTFIDPDRCAKTYNMRQIMQSGCRQDIVDRMAFARSMLKNLVDIEGADI
ncbi:serine/threonine-protein kinase PLK1-like [Littorina saxatilis]|uniref:Serine/threonine-protein kinase PLK n=1 Tax=Littorina saxatilis TaxID=31220 RepID=A0AAN9B7D9_9CAEN